MSQEEPWTIGRLLAWTTDYLKQRGAESPRLDAEVLLAAARDCERIELYTAHDEVPPDEVLTKFRSSVRKRAEGTPVAYLVGSREFYSLPFRVTPDVLIPRPETEDLVLALLDLAKSRVGEPDDIKIADVGTGSGILAVCAAKYIPGSHVTAIDVSPAALDIARSNSEKHGVADRIEVLESDLFEQVAADHQFDFIVSNPPYVSASEFAELSPDVRDHEPHTALVGGASGTEVIARLIPQAAERLRAAGWLIMEISPMILPAVRQLIEQDGHFGEAIVKRDLAGLARVISARRES